MTLDLFIAYLHEQVQNGSIYVWGGQGQTGNQITENWIQSRETSKENAARAIEFWKRQKEKGYTELRAFDCSGLGMYFLQNMHGVYKYDMSSASMYTKCQPLEKAKLKKGDWVFRKDSKNKIYHIGFVVDADLNVIEAKGRDDGVVQRPLNAQSGYWNAFGRPECFKDEIDKPEPEPIDEKKQRVKDLQIALNQSYGTKLAVDGIIGPKTTAVIKEHLLRYSAGKKMINNAYVQFVQKRLISLGYSLGKTGIDSVYGKNTAAAVKVFQQKKKITADGIVGINTIQKIVE